jgi:alpha-tubulin suppressor-like RCC1 family protein
MKKIFLILILFFTNHFYAQSNTDCFSIVSGQIIEVYENAQVGDTIATIQYCSSGEWKKIEAEFFSTLALKENGQLYTWGINSGGDKATITAGQDPTQSILFDPYLVKDPEDSSLDFLLDDVSSSFYLAFGIRSSDKSLWGWGQDQDASLGIGEDPKAVYPDYVNYRTPQLLNDSNTWKTVSAGYYHGNAIDTEGKLWGWGWATENYDANGFNTEIYTPTQVGTDSNWEIVSCGAVNTYLIKDDGTLWVMGLNISGSSGLGENPTENGIVQIGTDSDWKHVSSYSRSAIAIKNNGKMYVWGHNYFGNLGFDPNITQSISTPIQIPGTENINFIHADVGWKHGLAADIDGNFYGWGENLSGQLGNGEINTYEEFQLIETGGITTDYVSAAGRTSGFITTGGSMRMFGSNDTGQLGYGEDAITNPNTPVVVNLGEDLENATIIKYNSSAIAQGVLTDDGQLWVWGDNEFGRLGVGHADRVKENYYPNKIGEISDVWTDFSHSGSNLYAVKDNKLYGAGQNDNYNLGLGIPNTQTQLSMTEIPGVDVSEINTWQSSWAGFISIKNNGELWGFGGNWKGQLGISPSEQNKNTRNTIDLNGDNLGGINQVYNISQADPLRVSGDYYINGAQYTTNLIGTDAEFNINIDDNGAASIVVDAVGNSYALDEIITISGSEFGNNGSLDLTFQVAVFGDNEGTSHIPSYQKLNNDTDWFQIFDTKETDILIVEKTDGSIWFAGGNTSGDNELYDILGVTGYGNNGFVEIFPAGNDWNTFSSSRGVGQNGVVVGIKDDGTMWSFGDNVSGLAGVGSDGNWISEITQIGSDSDWRHINLNGKTSLAIKTDNSLWSWGSGWAGQLGNGIFGNSNQPVLASGDIQWETTGGGWLFQTGVSKDGTIYGWGYNRLGGLGGLGEVSSEYLDWITDVSIIDGAFTFSDLGYVIIQDTDAIDYETVSDTQGKTDTQGKNKNFITNAPIEITIPMTMSDGINTSDPENVIFKIINVNETPTDIELSSISFDEDNSIGSEISNISIIDPDLNDSHVLEIDSEFGDSSKFEIVDGNLRLTESISFHLIESLEIKILATDAGQLSFSKIFSITVNDINDAPVAVNDELTVLEDVLLTSTNVIVNDSDEDTNTDLMIINLSSDKNGTITINPDNISIDYIPEADFNGTEVITYTLSDGELTSTATLTVSVTSQNDAPVAEDGTITLQQGNSEVVTLIASDIDNDELSFSIQDQPANGSVTINGNQATFTANDTFTGSDSFTFSANDGSLISNTATITLDVTLNVLTFSLNNIKSYPNPFDEFYIIDSSLPIELEIYDLTGRTLRRYSLKEGRNRIDTSILSGGIYIFNYRYQSSFKSQILIKK